MSHFKTLVIGEDVEAQLSPFHEFESTGLKDKHVKDVDVTAEILKHFNEQEKEKNFKQYAKDYYGFKVYPEDAGSDLNADEYTYGYITVDGDTVKVIRRTNPNSKWDWYVIGGRYANRLLTKKGETVDSCLKKDLDIEGMRADRALIARAEYEEYEKHCEGTEPHRSWELIRSEVENIDKAREEYNNQPRVKQCYSKYYNPDAFLVTKEVYIKNAVDNAISAFAFLKDGEWNENGSMGWWGCVSDAKDPEEWNATVNKMIEGLNDEDRITVVDCHI